MKVRHITNEKDDESLADAIAIDGGVHVYDVGHELGRLFDDNDYDEWRWLVCDTKMSDDRLKDELHMYLRDAESFEVIRDEVIEKLYEMEDATRVALKDALDGGGKLHLVPMNLKRKHEPDGGTTVVLSDKDFALLISDEDVHTSVGEVAANARPAST